MKYLVVVLLTAVVAGLLFFDGMDDHDRQRSSMAENQNNNSSSMNSPDDERLKSLCLAGNNIKINVGLNGKIDISDNKSGGMFSIERNKEKDNSVSVSSNLGEGEVSEELDKIRDCIEKYYFRLYPPEVTQGKNISKNLIKWTKAGNVQELQRIMHPNYDLGQELDVQRNRLLHIAAQHCQAQVAEFLLSQGASKHDENMKDKKPYEMALEHCPNHQALLTLLAVERV